MLDKYQKLNISATTDGFFFKFLTEAQRTKLKSKMLLMKTTLMEDNLKILKVKSNQCLALSQILKYVYYEFLGGN